MVRSVQHELLAQPTADEASRQRFVVALKQHLNRELRPANQQYFEREAVPRFTAEHGHAPATRGEIRAAMYANHGYRTWCTLARTAQELMWESVADPLYRERPRLAEKTRELLSHARGSLELDPSFKPPRGVAAIDIHLQPGGYVQNVGDDDVMAGALYEAGGNLYAFGQGIGRNDSKAAAVQAFLREKFPDLKPRRILDMGCSAGSATVPYAQVFTDAEVHGIDVGAAMLRYAHARAEALGAVVHFHQRDVAATGFPDGHFDLVVSHNLMHEIPDATRRAMFAESLRMLSPGGVCVHQDVPLRLANLTPFQQFELSWDQRHNNEPYWEAYGFADVRTEMLAAGFPEDTLYVGHLPQRSGSLPWFIAVGVKPAA